MRKCILIKQVDVIGPNIFGFKSGIRFIPVDEPGWFLIKRDENKNIIHKIPINYKIASYKKGRIQLQYDDITINIWEHIGALRFWGIDGVGVEMINGSKWPPYLGGASTYLKKIIPYLQITDEDIPTIKVRNDYSWNYPENPDRFVSLERTEDDMLSLTISSRWYPFPKFEETIVVNQTYVDLMLDKVFTSKPQGYPGYNFYFARVLSILGWPNLKYISWPYDYKNNFDLAYDWWLHRVQDFLGDLSLADHVALPVGRGFSFNGGHLSDLNALKGSF